jgi:endonuclease/exonuclease/phosphatase (EEP) superfamily protein YafD
MALGVIGAHTGTLLALLAGAGWPAELFSHFPVQYAIAQIVGIGFFLVFRPRWFGLAGLPLLALNLWLLLPYYAFWQAAAASTGNEPSLRLMTLNLHANNTRADLVVQAIEAEDPDLVVLIEVTPEWWRALTAELQQRYPYHASERDAGVFGIALFSRLPFASHDIYHFGTYGRPAIAAQICPPSAQSGTVPECLHLLAIHPDPPITRSMAQSRDAQFEEVGEYLRDVKMPQRIVMGDMNATPWSPVLRNFMDQNALQDSALGRGVHSTWFSHSLLFGIPIDHILHSDGVGILDRRVGPDVGSDHFPLTADIALAPGE